jgi:hypothetical protein
MWKRVSPAISEVLPVDEYSPEETHLITRIMWIFPGKKTDSFQKIHNK